MNHLAVARTSLARGAKLPLLLILATMLAACELATPATSSGPTPLIVYVTPGPTPLVTLTPMPTPLIVYVTPAPTPTPTAKLSPKPKATPKPTPKPKPKPKYVTVSKAGNNRVTAWCPKGYDVLSGWYKLVGSGWLPWDLMWYPSVDYYIRVDGAVSSGGREGWRTTQLFDNDPDGDMRIKVSAKCGM